MYPSIQILITPTAAPQSGGAATLVRPTLPTVATHPSITLGDDGGSGSSNGGTNIGGTKSGLGLQAGSQGVPGTLIGWIPVYAPQASATSSSNAPTLGMEDGGSQSPTTQGNGNIGDPKSGLGFKPSS